MEGISSPPDPDLYVRQLLVDKKKDFFSEMIPYLFLFAASNYHM